MSRITVIGSLNMDLVIQTPYIPELGETITGHSFETIPGGKGANQATACAKLGARSCMIGRVGDDEFGQRLTLSLKNSGVDSSGIIVDTSEKTGVAMIMVCGANNLIVLSEGSNSKVSIADIQAKKDIIDLSEILLLQFEIPLETIAFVIKSYKGSKKIFLNPAPFKVIDNELLDGLYTIVPNENEAEKLCGVSTNSMEGVFKALDILKAKGVQYPIITLGDRGAAYFDGNNNKHMESFKVVPVDTTAAGDTFVGGLAVAIAEGKCIDESVAFAQKAAALATCKYGAQTSIPDRVEVDNFSL